MQTLRDGQVLPDNLSPRLCLLPQHSSCKQVVQWTAPVPDILNVSFGILWKHSARRWVQCPTSYSHFRSPWSVWRMLKRKIAIHSEQKWTGWVAQIQTLKGPGGSRSCQLDFPLFKNPPLSDSNIHFQYSESSCMSITWLSSEFILTVQRFLIKCGHAKPHPENSPR